MNTVWLRKKTNWPTLSAAAGALGAIAFSIVAALAEAVGFADFSYPLILGSWLSGTATASAWLLGLAVHMLLGAAVGLAYGTLFQVSGSFHLVEWRGWRIGALLGLGHWAIAGLLMGLVPDLPMPARAPSYFGSAYGGTAVGLVLVLHLVYGAVVGEAFSLALRRRLIRPLAASDFSARSPMADAEGQGLHSLEEYKRRRVI